MNFTGELRIPNVIHYGKDSLSKLGKEASKFGSKALLISDKPMNDLGYVNQIIESLQKENIQTVIYLGVDSETKDTHVEEALTIFNEQSCDLIVALGGGSCIDAAKAVALLATNETELIEYVGGKKEIENDLVPVIAIPTTAGTGSEVTDALVVTHTTKDIKMMIKQPKITPKVAIVDPILTQSAPKMLTVATGIDALCHALEAYISRKSHPLTDTLALSSIKLIVENIQRVYVDGKDLEARSQMALASMQAGIAFSNSSVCLVHGMSRPIGALFHVPHGISNAMLLSAVLDFSLESCTEKLAQIGRAILENVDTDSDEVVAEKTVLSIKHLCIELGIPNLQSWGINEEQFENSLEKMATDALASGSPGNNPRVPTKEEIIELYRVAFTYDYKNLKVLNA
ncbi:alcohol dehydrogenase [Lysinibacillus composti]|uniref:Iron-containing alcohol dehydrogenase n=1 Tax=Lysinibacillus composti TaxID=720633 RepID=A0A3N9UDP0_9BACI|nr:iron-containing alcohol dehydrogenase [Lysinibacillus composti]MBM7608832.1 alcohol dehydrogenase [Lysinibacillus composti]RQW74414.1 iron-containing alcohol dehydrogenase [Lysinibacillus composti]